MIVKYYERTLNGDISYTFLSTLGVLIVIHSRNNGIMIVKYMSVLITKIPKKQLFVVRGNEFEALILSLHVQ